MLNLSKCPYPLELSDAPVLMSTPNLCEFFHADGVTARIYRNNKEYPDQHLILGSDFLNPGICVDHI
jgi:hypothetical protein